MQTILSRFFARPKVANWLIERAIRTPYSHIRNKSDQTYMYRYWLFNPYNSHWWSNWLPSIRIHHIVLPDDDRALHDHPWDAKTFILKGWYHERRLYQDHHGEFEYGAYRRQGDTARLDFGEFHTIDEVSPKGVWTMFVTFKYRGTWGFRCNGKKVNWKEYLGVKE